MSISIFKTAPVACLFLAAAGTATAANNAQITITANVVAATCDVSLSTNNLDLGNFTPSQFTTVAVPVTSSVKKFTVGINNCETPKAASDTASLVVSGQTLGGNANMFNSTGTNTGIMISQTNAPTTYLNNGDKILIATAASSDPSSADLNGKTLSLQAGLASTSTTADIGAVNAPVLFSFAYN
ncbi:MULTISPECIES: fimbrial protein [unclassified Erwinia]|uniref:fimbrial protein n=1 Tax=unclassified Erwinia TaxID=2622719 RepID=UPI000833873E|nr:type 1 fimbrial protein [Erwinia sp. ErVv1]